MTGPMSRDATRRQRRRVVHFVHRLFPDDALAEEVDPGARNAEFPLVERRQHCKRACPNVVDVRVDSRMAWTCFGPDCHRVWAMEEAYYRPSRVHMFPLARFLCTSGNDDRLSAEDWTLLCASLEPVSFRLFLLRVLCDAYIVEHNLEAGGARLFGGRLWDRPAFVFETADGVLYVFLADQEFQTDRASGGIDDFMDD